MTGTITTLMPKKTVEFDTEDPKSLHLAEEFFGAQLATTRGAAFDLKTQERVSDFGPREETLIVPQFVGG